MKHGLDVELDETQKVKKKQERQGCKNVEGGGKRVSVLLSALPVVSHLGERRKFASCIDP